MKPSAFYRVIPYYNILDVPGDIHVCPVNCQPGVMGKGLALLFAKEFQGLRARHARLCNDRLLRPGRPSLLYRLTRGRWDEGWDRPIDFSHTDSQYNVVLFPTKDHWQEPSEIRWIWQGLGDLLDILSRYDDTGLCRIVLPSLGCGLGGLHFRDVEPVITAWAGCMSNQFSITLIKPREEKP